MNVPMKCWIAGVAIALCIFSISNQVSARPKAVTPRPIYNQLGIKVITPKTRSAYIRRGRHYNPDAAKASNVTWVRGHHVKNKGYRRAHLRKLHTPRIKLEFAGGTHVQSAAAQLVDTANKRGRPTIGLFNGTAIYAKPGDASSKVVRRWSDRMEQKAVKYRAAQARKAARPKKPQPTALELLAQRGNLLNPQRITTGSKLQAELEKKARKAGYGGWDFYGATNLRGVQEIAAFAKQYARVSPKVARTNIEFAILSKRVVSGTEARWQAALKDM